MNALIENYLQKPEDALTNFTLAKAYYEQKHYAEALSFFLRTAEFGEGNIRYAALIFCYFCYREVGGRGATLHSILKTAIANFPDHPEAYYHLCKLCENTQAYIDGYLFSCLGINQAREDKAIVGLDLEYGGFYDLYFKKALFEFWTDRPDDCRKTYQHILHNFTDQLNEGQKQFLLRELLNLGMAPEWKTIKKYSKEDPSNWPFSFDDIDTIETNYSQILQDMFVLYILNGKKNGTYLEVGSAYPYYTNNTALLETKFGWTGIGLDNNQEFVENYNQHRQNKTICTNAIYVDYKKVLTEKFGELKDIDYLQLDIQTPKDTYDVLKSLPLDEYKFAVITYEHDDYVDISREYKAKSREFLSSKGYVLAQPDISPVLGFSFEDWWVHPDLVDMTRVENMHVLSSLNWGSMNEKQIKDEIRKIVKEKAFDYWVQPKAGDIVVDIGFGVGAFAVYLKNRQIYSFIGIEPSDELLKVSSNNISQATKVKVNLKDAESFKFIGIINDLQLAYIDYLKITNPDAIQNIFDMNNIPYLQQNVMFMAIEFDVSNEEQKTNFKTFRDKILPCFYKWTTRSCSEQNIVPGETISLDEYISNDEFIDNYNYPIMVYINNRNVVC